MRNMQCAKFKVQSKDMDILQYTFFQNALIGALLASILCGFVGTYIVTRRLVFISGGITHASFGGIGIGVFAGIPRQAGAPGRSASASGIISSRSSFR